MNRLLIGTIAFCALVTVAGFFASEHRAPIDELIRHAPAAADVTSPVHASPAREFLPETDTTGLLRESLTVDELLDEISADSGDALTPEDRERLAVELRDVLGD